MSEKCPSKKNMRSINRVVSMVVIVSVLVSCGEIVTEASDRLPQLIEALGQRNNRQGAAIALTKIGKSAVPDLRKALVSEVADVRIWSAYTLGQIGPDASSAVVDLLASLDNSDESLRATTAEALGKIGDSSAAERLVQALQDKNVIVRQRVILALGKIGSGAVSALPQLIELLSDPDVRIQTRHALIQIGLPAVKGLTESLDEDSIRFDIAMVLRDIDSLAAKKTGVGSPSLADLRSLRLAMNDSTRELQERSTAANSLATLGEKGIDVLVVAFSDEEIADVASAAFANADAKSISQLTEALSHEQPEVRIAAANAVARLGPKGSEAVESLILLIEQEDRDVRYHAVRALHELGTGASPSVSALAKVILNEREQETTRTWAIKTLVVTLPKTRDAVVKALTAASGEEKNYGVRQLAKTQLQKIEKETANER
jgi:HEAT repeat protein